MQIINCYANVYFYFFRVVLKWMQALKKLMIQTKAEFYHAIMLAI